MKMNEENFIGQLKRKNEKALDYVIETYGRLIKMIVSKHLFSLKNHQEECINDVLLAVWENIDQGLTNILEHEISDDLNELLACLKEEDRDIFIKLFFEEKEVEIISKETGLKPSVIYNRVSRGKRKMKRLYEERKGI